MKSDLLFLQSYSDFQALLFNVLKKKYMFLLNYFW